MWHEQKYAPRIDGHNELIQDQISFLISCKFRITIVRISKHTEKKEFKKMAQDK